MYLEIQEYLKLQYNVLSSDIRIACRIRFLWKITIFLTGFLIISNLLRIVVLGLQNFVLFMTFTKGFLAPETDLSRRNFVCGKTGWVWCMIPWITLFWHTCFFPVFLSQFHFKQYKFSALESLEFNSVNVKVSDCRNSITSGNLFQILFEWHSLWHSPLDSLESNLTSQNSKKLKTLVAHLFRGVDLLPSFDQVHKSR